MDKVIDYNKEMTFYLHRFYTVKMGNDLAKLGYLTNESGTIYLATLENLDYMIPEGCYDMSYTKSSAFSHREPYKNLAGGRVPLLDVPYRKGIRIHVGNWASESQGCILLGTHHANGMVADSRLAYRQFMIHVVIYNFASSRVFIDDTDELLKYRPEVWKNMDELIKKRGLCLRKK